MSTTATIPGTFQIEVAADRMSAMLIIDAGAAVTVHDVFGRIKKLGIRGFDDGAIIEALESRGESSVKLEFVRGEPAVDPTPDQLEFLVPISDGAGGEFTRVEADQMLARVTPGQPARDGYDVFRNPLHGRKQSHDYVGTGVALHGDKLKATVAGSFRMRHGVASVSPVAEIEAGDVDAKRASVHKGDLLIKGSLQPRQRVQAVGGIVVQGGIEGASFRSGEWAHIQKAIVGNDKCRAIVGGNLFARGIRTMRVSALGDVKSNGDVLDCQIQCVGELDVAGHAIVGGEAIANGGVRCGTLGSEEATPTVIEVGIDEPLRATLAETRTMVQAYRERLQQADKSMKSLRTARAMTAEQKDRACGVMAEVCDVRQDAQRRITALVERCQTAKSRQKCEVHVSKMLHGGVTLRFPGFEATTADSVAGPLRIHVEHATSGPQIIIDQADGTSVTLPTSAREGEYAQDVRSLLEAGQLIESATARAA